MDTDDEIDEIEKLLEIAKDTYDDGNVEFDEVPAISEGTDGYWVAAWVFVPKEQPSDDGTLTPTEERYIDSLVKPPFEGTE